MNKDANHEELPIRGQDFANPEKDEQHKPSSHGEVNNQPGSDFSDLEESRMENPPEHRDKNGSEGQESNHHSETEQADGIDE